ncbi:hypothetical protein GUJ93_ZPchr0458g22548 [Zizania palustris]|uniref:UDP-N-acetylglucosamine diphosphorylase n=1 Tax=Zizania palustris TaxID=103762 RepID=A0A8J5RCJ9_ZIZPA|nr:hypothetical protein GUJ93_ZPchr0458g22548 [Zizania palustris]
MKEIVVGSVAPAGRWGAAAPPQALLERMKDYGQEGAFALWDELSPEDRELLVRDIEVRPMRHGWGARAEVVCALQEESFGFAPEFSLKMANAATHTAFQSLDLSRIDRIIRRSLGSRGLKLPAVEPVPESGVSKVEERSPEDKERWWKKGLKAISEGKLAVVLLAGGQGTRLGSPDPKGCFSVGLPSGKSLFQLQAERILCVQKLAAQSSDSPSNIVPIHWYVMTSPFTDDITRKFFESRKYFGLEADQVTFFQQGTLPCVSADSRFIMETPYKVAKAPDGNGGVYAALKSKKLLEDMSARGVKYVDCYGVDNALVRVADPTFLGYFIDKGVSSAAKVVRKVHSNISHAPLIGGFTVSPNYVLFDSQL